MNDGKGRSSYRWRNYIKPMAYKRDLARNARCWLCGGEIDYTASNNPTDKNYSKWAWEPDHIKDVSTHPELAEDITNIAPSHSCCNRRRKKKHKKQTINEIVGNNSRNWG